MDNKIEATFEIQSDQKEWLNKITKQYEIADPSKALRILMDYAIEDGDCEEIFAPENSRCRHCG